MSIDEYSGVCVQFDDAVNRKIYSLVLANGRLYAGLGRDGSKNGLIWNCDPTVANSCDDFNDPGKTDVNALAVGADLWAGLKNGIIWHCSLDEADSCLNWYDTEEAVKSISFDAEDGTTFYAGIDSGGIYTCSTNGDCTLSHNTGEPVASVAGGDGLCILVSTLPK